MYSAGAVSFSGPRQICVLYVGWQLMEKAIAKIVIKNKWKAPEIC